MLAGGGGFGGGEGGGRCGFGGVRDGDEVEDRLRVCGDGGRCWWELWLLGSALPAGEAADPSPAYQSSYSSI